MHDKIFVMGWIDPYGTEFEKAKYTPERRDALVTRIKKRKYYFNFFDHEMLGVVPLYSDYKYCILTKPELDEVFARAYKDIDIECRKLPYDEEETIKYGGILYEKHKYIPKEDDDV